MGMANPQHRTDASLQFVNHRYSELRCRESIACLTGHMGTIFSDRLNKQGLLELTLECPEGDTPSVSHWKM